MLKTKKFDVLNYLKTEEDIKAYIDAFIEEKDGDHLQLALADVARAREVIASAASLHEFNAVEA